MSSKEWTLENIKIGDKFKLTEKGIWWVKLNTQGMNDQYSSIRTVESYKTRCQRKSKRNKVISIHTKIYF